MTFVRACGTDDVSPDKPFAATVEDVEIAVARQDDEWFAIQDLCSHAEVALSEGDVEDTTIECWLHGSTFDLRSGKPTSLPAFKPVATYPVEIRDADVYVDVTSPLNGVPTA